LATRLANGPPYGHRLAADLTSSYSSGNGGQCVEVARNLPGVVTVRDSRDRHGHALSFAPADWRTFTRLVKDGRFDPA
jgi:Domain of unknown function (DUF397)